MKKTSVGVGGGGAAKKASQAKKTVAATSSASRMEEDEYVEERVIGGNKARTVEEKYTKMEQRDHVLARPDMYIGSTRRIAEELWVWDASSNAMVQRTVTYSPGLYKIFDEVLVNAADNYQRDPSMKVIKVEINQSTGTISVHNDGHGIPIEIHKKHKMYVPEMIFGELLTGSSFDDSEAKVTGGRNGLGAKLANIYSSEFVVEARCEGKQFKQNFYENMSRRSSPSISAASGADFTKISFRPDFKRFDGMERLDDDIFALMAKRVIDVAGCNSKLNVYLNGAKVDIRSFKDYVSLYFKTKDESERPDIIGPEIICDSTGRKRWEVAFAVSSTEFQQVSFVNSIWTIRGGTHVNAVVKKISDHVTPIIKKKNKGTEVKPTMIQNSMFLFINSLIVNPEFDSQTKETLKSKQTTWGTKPELPDAFLTKVATKSGMIEQILLWNQSKSAQALKTSTAGKKRGRLGISKLTEANMAATSKADRCTLIITEGDSAKGLALAGLSVVGRDYYGIFPLRGKVLNVRDASVQKVVANEELNMIKKTMGLQHDKHYDSVQGLRYGRIMIMTDQDHDGSHIKGLFINFIHHYWPSLLRVPGFLCEFVTPIVKATKGERTHAFFTIPQYQEWCAANNTRGWTIKYYKGLGTSEPAEMQEYFGDLPKHKKDFRYIGPEDDSAIQLAFAKANADQRKEWLASYQPGTHLDQSLTKIPYHEFINKELILFSLEDCERSIASMMDGFKPGQRKITFACFKRNLKGEIKIAQLAGYVLEHCAYHHGEVSLYSTMIGMAQNFVGSNNLNLLEPVGNFGSRDQGGKDAAAARYIFTTLSPLTRYIFHPDDDDVLDYLEDEGMRIEPKWYAPIIPMVLVNGNAGIGTGWSSFVPNYNPRDVVANLRRLINNEETEAMHPWYRGFQGTIESDEKQKGRYECSGVWRRIDDEWIEVTELPIGTWTQSYKNALEEMILANEAADKKAKQEEKKIEAKKKKQQKSEEDAFDDEEFGSKKKRGKKAGADDDGDKEAGERTTFSGITIKDFKEYHTTTRVHFTIQSPDFASMSDEAIEKTMKLRSKISITNMHLFDAEGRIKKYPSAEDILKDFFITRVAMYEKRKNHLVDQIGRDMKVLDNKMRFIKEVIEKTLVVSNRKKTELFAELRKKGYDPIPKASLKKKVNSDDAVELLPQGEEHHDDEDEDEETFNAKKKKQEEDEEDPGTRDYDYLLSMAIWSLTAERYKKLMEQVAEKAKELKAMKAVHAADLWERDLDAFEDAWNRFEQNMAILDQCGVGGSAFRKPSLQASSSSSTSASDKNAKAKKDKLREEFKKLQKLLPVKAAQPPPIPHPDRPEILLPDVKTDPIIPPSKVKREVGISSPKSAATVKKQNASSSSTSSDIKTGKASILSYVKPEVKPQRQLSEDEILALPLSERLALRAQQSGASAPTMTSPIKNMSLDEFIDNDEYGEAKTKTKRPRAPKATASLDLSESDDFGASKPLTKKPKAAAASKKVTIKTEEDDDEIATFRPSQPAAKKLASAPKKSSAPKKKKKDWQDDEDDASMDFSDDENSDDMILDSDEDVPTSSRPKRATAKSASARMKAAKDSDADESDGEAFSEDDFKPAPKPAKRAAAPSKMSVDDDLFALSDSEVDVKPKTSAAKKLGAAKPAAAASGKKTSGGASAATKKVASRVSKMLDSDDDDDLVLTDSDDVPAKPRPKRASAAKVSGRFKPEDSDSEDFRGGGDSDDDY